MPDPAVTARPKASLVPQRWSLAVLLAGLALGALAGWGQQRANDARVQARLEAAAAQTAQQLRQRMQSYEYALFATRGAVRVAGTTATPLTREAFRRFTGSFDLRRRFPGARGIGFVRRLAREQDAAFLAEMRRQGEQDFGIRELGPNPLDTGERYLLLFLEPAAADAGVEGLDLATEVRRREALRRAMLSGEPQLSAPLTLLQPGAPPERAFVLALPIYTRAEPIAPAQRAAATYGWAVMPLVADEVLADLDTDPGALAVALSDVRGWGPPERFYASPGWHAQGRVPVRSVALPVFGREWLVEVQALPGFVQRLERTAPAAMGLTVAAAFAALALLVHGALRTAERRRHEEALRRRTEQAEAANQAKSAFLAHMSHEIRTPLNAVIGLSQLLERMPLQDKQRLYVDHIAAAGTQLLALVNDVLDFSKIEAGEMRLESAPFELQPLLQELRTQAAVQAAHKPLAVQLDLEPGLPQRLRGDPTRLRQVLSNLLGNAVKFTAEGSVTLQVRRAGPASGDSGATGSSASPGTSPGTGAGPEGGGDGGRVWLCFDVIDTGIGIAAEQQAAVFEPFTQADASTTRRFGGTGLGLSIVKRLVALMGGQLSLHSAAGAGSRFSVTLPLQTLE